MATQTPCEMIKAKNPEVGSCDEHMQAELDPNDPFSHKQQATPNWVC